MTDLDDIRAADLNDLYAAEAQGERALHTLRPGDGFIFRGHHMIARMQWNEGRRDIFVTTTPEDGYPKGRTFLLNGLLMFPAFLSDEHFAAEQAKLKDW
jgi:hypothetical protein